MLYIEGKGGGGGGGGGKGNSYSVFHNPDEMHVSPFLHLSHSVLAPMPSELR